MELLTIHVAARLKLSLPQAWKLTRLGNLLCSMWLGRSGRSPAAHIQPPIEPTGNARRVNELDRKCEEGLAAMLDAVRELTELLRSKKGAVDSGTDDPSRTNLEPDT